MTLVSRIGKNYMMWSCWQDLLLYNTLDVMHCERNLCENVIKTIFVAKDIVVI